MKPAAIILIVLGIAIVIWGGFGFATREEHHNIPFGPLAGAVIVLGGVVLLLKGRTT